MQLLSPLRKDSSLTPKKKETDIKEKKDKKHKDKDKEKKKKHKTDKKDRKEPKEKKSEERKDKDEQDRKDRERKEKTDKDHKKDIIKARRFSLQIKPVPANVNPVENDPRREVKKHDKKHTETKKSLKLPSNLQLYYYVYLIKFTIKIIFFKEVGSNLNAS